VKRLAIVRKVLELEFTTRERTRMARAGDKHKHQQEEAKCEEQDSFMYILEAKGDVRELKKAESEVGRSWSRSSGIGVLDSLGGGDRSGAT
jgi:hypothetical protein